MQSQGSRGDTSFRRAVSGSAPPSLGQARRRCTLASVDERLLAWFEANGRDLPWRRTRDPYAILVSEVMLQQTQVERVIPRYLAWLERWPTVEALAAATPGDVIREWQGLGYNRRAVNLHRAARQIAAAGWPADLDGASRRRPLHGGRCRGLRARRARRPGGHERPARPGAHGAPVRAGVRPGAHGSRGDRLPRPHPALRRLPAREGCPSRGRRYEPLRKQGHFEGSFRQRRARVLRAVASAPHAAEELDADAVRSLERDGLVAVVDGSVRLPA